MGHRSTVIAKSITTALLDENSERPRTDVIPAYFNIHWTDFTRVGPQMFESLRQLWRIDDKDYLNSFSPAKAGGASLRSLGDMGFSGSTFYVTADSAYMVKSVPRHFEYSFFQDDLLGPYVEHMQNNIGSLLVRITDFLKPKHSTIGINLGIAPSHHIVMENTKYGQEEEEEDRHNDSEGSWESYDLKPLSYFYPERDVAHGVFATDEATSKLADKFNDKLVLDLDVAEEFKAQLEKDTALLARCTAVDYSLFLVRIPVNHPALQQHQADSTEQQSNVTAPVPPAQPPFVPPGPPNWRTGMKSADGKWLYRVSILDFFWAKQKTAAKLMTGLIKSYNLLDRQGPMSITTTSDEYRDRFLRMCKDMIQIRENDQQ